MFLIIGNVSVFLFCFVSLVPSTVLNTYYALDIYKVDAIILIPGIDYHPYHSNPCEKCH